MADEFKEPYIPKMPGMGHPQNFGAELGQAMGGFAQAIQQTQLQRSLSSATDELQQMRLSEASDNEMNKRRAELSNQLGSQMIGYGMPYHEIAALQHQFAPPPAPKPQFANPSEVFAYGTPQQKQDVIDGMNAMHQKEPDPLTEELRRARLGKIDDEEKDRINKRFTLMGDAIDPTKGRTGEFGRMQTFVDNADRALVYKKQFPDANLPRAQFAELAVAQAALVGSGNAPAESTVSRFIPNTSGDLVAKMMDFYDHHPHGTDNQDFARAMFDTAEREKSLAHQKIKEFSFAKVPRFSDLEGRDKDRFEAQLEAAKIDPSEYRAYKNNHYKMPSEMQIKIQTAKDNGYSNEEIGKFLKDQNAPK